MSETQPHGIHIEKLIGHENYATWKFAMRALLESEDLWGCVQEEMEYTANVNGKDVLSVDKLNYNHIQNTTTSMEVWLKLQATFEDISLSRKIGLLRTLTTAKLQESKSVEAYVNKIIDTAHKLKDIGSNVDDEMIGTLLSSGLLDEYKPMIMGLESSGIAITSDAIKVKLLQEVKTTDALKPESEEAAFLSKSKGHY